MKAWTLGGTDQPRSGAREVSYPRQEVGYGSERGHPVFQYRGLGHQHWGVLGRYPSGSPVLVEQRGSPQPLSINPTEV
ncbi:hypothetical protein GECvBN6_gp040c [Salmonella phage GEC_vB_N6]|nr:hypothetical protein GECvBN6_gp040c [Salmonella phage GEC_vB_N6]